MAKVSNEEVRGEVSWSLGLGSRLCVLGEDHLCFNRAVLDIGIVNISFGNYYTVCLVSVYILVLLGYIMFRYRALCSLPVPPACPRVCLVTLCLSPWLSDFLFCISILFLLPYLHVCLSSVCLSSSCGSLCVCPHLF